MGPRLVIRHLHVKNVPSPHFSETKHRRLSPVANGRSTTLSSTVQNQKRDLEKSALTLHRSGRDGEIAISWAKATGWKRLPSDTAEELIRVFLWLNVLQSSLEAGGGGNTGGFQNNYELYIHKTTIVDVISWKDLDVIGLLYWMVYLITLLNPVRII